MNSRASSRAHRTARHRVVIATVAAAMSFAGLSALAVGTASAAPGTTVVSLNFDDGFASQMDALPIMQSHGYTGTFYIISGMVDLSGRLTTANLKTIADAGNEIGGHTTKHADLTTLTPIEQQRTICNDRLALSQLGFTVTDFAYPYGSYDSTVQQSVIACGYNSARATGGIGYGQAPSESIPPADPYAINAADGIVSTTTLSSIEDTVRNAMRHGGGWVPLLFHNVCTGCNSMAITKANFTALLDWLKAQEPNGLAVRTMAQVINQPAQPVVAGPPDTRPEGTLVNASLETPSSVVDPIAGAVLPDCWEAGGYGTNTGTWDRTNTTSHDGVWAETLNLTSVTSGDRKLMMRRDEGTCSPGVVAGHSYTLGAWYQSSVPTRFVLYYGDLVGRWTYWMMSPVQPASSTWRQITWTTPALPSVATHMSFGLQIATTGYLTSDDYSMSVKQ